MTTSYIQLMPLSFCILLTSYDVICVNFDTVDQDVSIVPMRVKGISTIHPMAMVTRLQEVSASSLSCCCAKPAKDKLQLAWWSETFKTIPCSQVCCCHIDGYISGLVVKGTSLQYSLFT